MYYTVPHLMNKIKRVRSYQTGAPFLALWQTPSQFLYDLGRQKFVPLDDCRRVNAPSVAYRQKVEKRIALVIGNSSYDGGMALPNPRNDANDIGASLKRLGFEVILRTDLDKRGMDEAF